MPTKKLRTTADIQREIEALQTEMKARVARERDGVLKSLIEAMETYSITFSELKAGAPAQKGSAGVASKQAESALVAAVPAKKKRGGRGGKREPKYRDFDGETWAGGGSQPRWLKARLAAGHTLDEFLIPEKKRGKR